MIPLILIILAVSLVTSLIIFALSFLKNHLFKYIPSFILLLFSIIFIIKAKFFSVAFEDLGYIILFMIAIGAFSITIIVSLIIEKWFQKK